MDTAFCARHVIYFDNEQPDGRWSAVLNSNTLLPGLQIAPPFLISAHDHNHIFAHYTACDLIQKEMDSLVDTFNDIAGRYYKSV